MGKEKPVFVTSSDLVVRTAVSVAGRTVQQIQQPSFDFQVDHKHPWNKAT